MRRPGRMRPGLRPHMCGLAERRMRRSEDGPHVARLGGRACAPPPRAHCARGTTSTVDLTSHLVCDWIPASMRTAPAGLPPGPRLPRAVQSVIWYRRAQWLMDQCQARFGDMFTLKIADEGNWVMTSDPDTIKQVFTGDPRLLHAGEANRILLPVLGPELGAAARRRAAPAPAQADAGRVPRRADAALRRADGRHRRRGDRALAAG